MPHEQKFAVDSSSLIILCDKTERKLKAASYPLLLQITDRCWIV